MSPIVIEQHPFLSASDRELSYTVLAVLSFSSARKRMSVILRDDSDGSIQLLSKGADNVMLKLLRDGNDLCVRLTEQHMQDHANDGLRTLVLARKDLDEVSFREWQVGCDASN